MDRARLPRALWVVIALLIAWASPSAARACSCLRPPPPLAAAEKADVVFEGRAAAPTTESMRIRTPFEVLRTFKGDTGTYVDVLTMSSSAACGRSYVPGETYLVYAFQSNGSLADNLCSRTRRSSEAGVDFEVLGGGQAPTGLPEDDDAATNVEAPRIEPPATSPPPVQPERRGCAASVAGLPHTRGAVLMSVLLLLGVASHRRRAYRGCGISPPRRPHVARTVRNPTARQ
ncbi:MAG: hypothetical protein ACRBN8_36815 [Nannocystales bacterium]